jgi:hypothetical protein
MEPSPLVRLATALRPGVSRILLPSEIASPATRAWRGIRAAILTAPAREALCAID